MVAAQFTLVEVLRFLLDSAKTCPTNGNGLSENAIATSSELHNGATASGVETHNDEFTGESSLKGA